ncbi:hypothetical protein D4764_07G0008710 [Takifugu flavidus]|uniref:Uncharacterized protein n=1 Tax=Takifugu flavidus TaxID=433684 RepID=A0A5C6MSE7_9TELE|nr:hypothetical protein D4764_07G0008710 [Takifugu flavidus]
MLDMAGYFGLNILLWAGIVTLASPPTQPPAAPQCSYTLKPIKFGFRLTISNSTTGGLYILTLQEQDDMTEKTYSSDKTSSDISDLKPCTNYRHRLALKLQHGVIDCNQTKNTTATLQPKMEDFQNVESLPEHICYRSKWNIRSLLTQPNNMQLRDDDTFCIRYDSKDICTNFTTNVSTSCGSFPFTKFINLDPSHITMRPLDVYPAKIEPTFPPNCKNWTVEHVCSDLSYSTEYTVQASTFNGHFESSPRTRTTSTSYNEPALINFLIFLIFVITSGLLILVAYKIYTRRRKRSRARVFCSSWEGVCSSFSSCAGVLCLLEGRPSFVSPGGPPQLRVSWRAAPASCLLEGRPSFVSPGGPPQLRVSWRAALVFLVCSVFFVCPLPPEGGEERRGEERRGEERRRRGEERGGEERRGEGRGGKERRGEGERRGAERGGGEGRIEERREKERRIQNGRGEEKRGKRRTGSETFAWLVHSHQDCMLDMAGYFGLNILLWAGIVTLASQMEDFQNVESSPKRICYQSEWDIRSLLTQPNNMQLRDNIFCIRYDLKDICTNFTTNVPTSCGSFPFTKFINLDPSHITLRPLDVYPAKIETTLPPNCKNWTVEHVCSEKGSPHQNKSPKELEPYTDYSCAAVVTRGTVSMRTQDIDIRIDCNLTIYECSKSNVLTNTSMNLHWNLTSSVCKDLFTRFNFSYDCYCHNPVKGGKDVKSQQVSCSFSALDVFKDYTCGINVKYKKFSVLDRVFGYRTEPGIPETPRHLKLDVHEHNQITVKVDKISRFNGPSEFYIVRLYEGKTHKETRNGTKRREERRGEERRGEERGEERRGEERRGGEEREERRRRGEERRGERGEERRGEERGGERGEEGRGGGGEGRGEEGRGGERVRGEERRGEERRGEEREGEERREEERRGRGEERRERRGEERRGKERRGEGERRGRGEERREEREERRGKEKRGEGRRQEGRRREGRGEERRGEERRG